jgi:phage N-6-adenine-methyltransferase
MSDNMQFVQKNEKDEWITPAEIIDPIVDAYGGIDLDPCAGQQADHADRNYRLPETDGLNADWDADVVFVNPPFSQKSQWIEKSVLEYEKGNAGTVLMLTPDSTDVQGWWHGQIAPNFAWTWFPEGRINYVDPDKMEQSTGVSFGSALSIMGEAMAFLHYAERNGDLVYRGALPSEIQSLSDEPYLNES